MGNCTEPSAAAAAGSAMQVANWLPSKLLYDRPCVLVGSGDDGGRLGPAINDFSTNHNPLPGKSREYASLGGWVGACWFQ